jgi:hypothetical protein
LDKRELPRLYAMFKIDFRNKERVSAKMVGLPAGILNFRAVEN